MTLRLSSLPETYNGPLGEPVIGTFMGLSAADKHPGLFALHFLTPHGPLTLFAHGEAVQRNGATLVALRSKALNELGLDGEDFGDDFRLVAGRHTNKEGKAGKVCVVGIERTVNRAEELLQFVEEVEKAEADAASSSPATAPVNGTAATSNGSAVVESKGAGDVLPPGGFDEGGGASPASNSLTPETVKAKVPHAVGRPTRKGRAGQPP